jgi:hypothetical protein
MAYANPPDRAGQADRALRILKDGRTHRMKDLMKERVWPETMTRLVQDGLVLRPAHGYYRINPARFPQLDIGWARPDGAGRASPYTDKASPDEPSSPTS